MTSGGRLRRPSLNDARVFLAMSIVYEAAFCVLWPFIRQPLSRGSESPAVKGELLLSEEPGKRTERRAERSAARQADRPAGSAASGIRAPVTFPLPRHSFNHCRHSSSHCCWLMLTKRCHQRWCKPFAQRQKPSVWSFHSSAMPKVWRRLAQSLTGAGVSTVSRLSNLASLQVFAVSAKIASKYWRSYEIS